MQENLQSVPEGWVYRAPLRTDKGPALGPKLTVGNMNSARGLQTQAFSDRRVPMMMPIAMPHRSIVLGGWLSQRFCRPLALVGQTSVYGLQAAVIIGFCA